MAFDRGDSGVFVSARDIPIEAAETGDTPAAGASAVAAGPSQILYEGRTYPLYPERLAVRPELPSPVRLEAGTEVVMVVTRDDHFTLVPVTVENGSGLNYARRQWGKGRQLAVDAADFPTLAATGLHSESELRQTKSITGQPVALITQRGRPMELSGAGFLTQDEDIISVLIGDNRLVAKLGLKLGGYMRC